MKKGLITFLLILITTSCKSQDVVLSTKVGKIEKELYLTESQKEFLLTMNEDSIETIYKMLNEYNYNDFSKTFSKYQIELEMLKDEFRKTDNKDRSLFLKNKRRIAKLYKIGESILG